MLRYTTKDIINRAKELADLKNSDFISWGENMRLLDEGYKKLYQQMIAANDKYYLKKCEVKDLTSIETADKEQVFELPSDFYQLAQIYIKNSNKPITRKAPSESISADRYDIVRNNLILYGSLNMRTVEIVYYPIPKTLTLSCDEFKFSGLKDALNNPANDTILDTCGNCFIFGTYAYEGGDSTYTFMIYNISSGTIRTAQKVLSGVEGGNIKLARLGKTGFYARTEGGKYFYYDLKKCDFYTDSQTFLSDKVCLKNSGNLLFMGEEDTSYRIYTIKNNVVIQCDLLSLELPTYTNLQDNFYCGAISNDFQSVYLIYDSTGILDFTEMELYENDTLIRGVSDAHIDFLSNKLCYVADDVFIGSDKVLNEDDFKSFLGFNKIDYDTGYGFLVTSMDDDDLHLKTCFTDTQLDFPNNFYFSYLAYVLAISYKIKQNADSQGLQALLGEETQQFFNSLSRDGAENQRITNVYTNGGIYG